MQTSNSKQISFIIPVRPGNYPSKAIEHIYALNYPKELFEIIIAEGSNPSLQRNKAVAESTGEIIYFLDDDSLISPDSINLGLKYFHQERVAAVGGPALGHPKAAFIDGLIARVLGSFFGSFTTRTRFSCIGEARPIDGEGLILCNLMVHKSIFQKLAGLNINLYPNEENELFKRMREAGYGFYYIPQMTIQKPTRNSFAAFIKQMFSYGRGRGHHILRNFSPKDLVFFVPSLFVAYLFFIIAIPNLLLAIPLFAYLLFIGLGALEIGIRNRSALSAIASFPLFATMHLSYGTGLIYGLVEAKQNRSSITSPVKLTKFALQN
jgi:succinoglycan biosynthesis protein ExoA